MKKIICIVLCILALSTIISFAVNRTFKDSNTEKSESYTEPTLSTDATQKQTDKSTSSTNKVTSSANNNTNNTNSSASKGVLRKVSTSVLKTPKALGAIARNESAGINSTETIQANAVTYDVGGNIVDWEAEGDTVYVITKWNNRLIAIDSESKSSPCYASLDGVPSEMNITDDSIYVALPTLKRIDVFSKSDCKRISSYSFEHEISSFCVDGVYIYYADNEGWCSVYRKNLVTYKVTEIKQYYSLFHEPKLLLNKEDGILYIGEANYTGSTLYYYDAETLNFKSKFQKNDYADREIFHVGDNVYWGGCCFSDTNAEQIKGEYGASGSGSMLYASQGAVFTEEGIFSADTYESIVNYSELNFEFKEIIISESGNIFAKRSNDDETVLINIKI